MCRLRNISLESVTEKCDGRTDRQTDGQRDPYVSLCFAGHTKMMICNGNKIHDLDCDVIRHWIHIKRKCHDHFEFKSI